ncbi:uncharacterized protein si:ch211-151h10.2 [Conger conger]|uniref:uncharacterized protein si:ch211-151h10.2 n=1 Tax=Conger conger TaxID=82655 RepID=UPI002A5A1FBF|nr:uncharacterized protein si:ch211-151h10.2 [Conger conger]
MPPSVVIGPCPRWLPGTPGTAAESPHRRTDGHGEAGQARRCGASRRARLQCGRACSWGWQALVVAGELWALSQEEAPLHPSLSLGQVRSRALLAAGVGVSMALCVLVLRALCPGRPRQRVPFLHTAEEKRNRAPGPQASLPSGRSVNGPVSLAKALMDSLLLCLLSEAVEDPGPAHIQALAHRLEMVEQTLGRADVLAENPRKRCVSGQRGNEESLLLTDSLQDVCAFLQERAQCLRALAQAQEDYGKSIEGVKEVLEEHWVLLVQLHIQVIRGRKRREQRVRAAMRKKGERKEGEREEGEREGREEEKKDIKMALQNVECFSVELSQRKDSLQQSRALLCDITHLLQELGGGLQALGERGGGGSEPLWTEGLLQSNTQQFDEVLQDFLSLEKLTSCFLTHLEGLRANSEHRSHPKLTSASAQTPAQTPAPHVQPPDAQPRPPVPPPDLPKLPLSLCEQSAQCLSSSFSRLHSALSKV